MKNEKTPSVYNGFIKLTRVISNWDGSQYRKVVDGDVYVRLHTIDQIGPLHEEIVYPDDAVRQTFRYKDAVTHPKARIATINTSTLYGRGVNGISTNLDIDEDSYYALLDALGIPRSA